MSECLVCILGETRASETTYESFNTNVLNYLKADLAICIGITNTYNKYNSFYARANYIWTFPEMNNWANAYDHAATEEKPPNYSVDYNNTNYMFNQLNIPKTSNHNIIYIGDFVSFDLLQNYLTSTKEFKYEAIVWHDVLHLNQAWRNQAYGVIKIINSNSEPGVRSLTKNSNWRKLLDVKDQWLGGIKDANGHPGSAGILIFFRWFLLKNLKENNLINKYKRFIVTRSDYLYLGPHPSLQILDENYVWIPDGEFYGGLTDRHVIISNIYIESYLNIMQEILFETDKMYNEMKNTNSWNLEKVIYRHLEKKNLLDKVKLFPFIMYTIREKTGTTRWSIGTYNEKLGYYIKYQDEYKKAIQTADDLKNCTNVNQYYLSKFRLLI